jgi:hypothetical protein
MSTRLRDAVVQQLRAMGGASAEGAVRRFSVEVEVGGRVETVIVGLRDDALQCVSSDGSADGPHVAAALRFIVGLETHVESLSPAPSLSPAVVEEPSATHELADAFDDVITAVARVGVRGAQYAPSVDAALQRLVDAGAQPTPSGLGRFVARMQTALRSEDPARAARLLDGASRLVEALRDSSPDPSARRRIDAWLGARIESASNDVGLLYDRTMVEVGREWLSGGERASIERRYLVDVQSGAVYREDRPRNAVASLGPCPRELRVGLAEVESGPTPDRVRILQYEVEPYVHPETWERLKQVASRSFSEVTDAYRRALVADSALSEPFALVKPYRIERNGVFKAFDSDGHQLVLDRSERRGAVLAFYDLLADGLEPSWLAGRLTDTGATVCMTPFAVGASDGRYIRL